MDIFKRLRIPPPAGDGLAAQILAALTRGGASCPEIDALAERVDGSLGDEIECGRLLRFAAIHGHEGMTRALVEKSGHGKAAMLSVGETRQTPLMAAASRGHAPALLALLAGSDLSAQDNNGRTALRHAAQEGNPNCVRFLLAAHDARGEPPQDPGLLIEAAKAGCAESVQLLLARCDARAMDAKGKTALMWAAGNGHADAVRVLWGPSDLDQKSATGKTAFGYAAGFADESRRHDAVAVFLEKASEASPRLKRPRPI